MRMRRSALLLAATLGASPALAQQDPLAPLPESAVPEAPPPASTPVTTVPVPMPSPAVRVPRDWREVFAAIRGGRWAEARAGISALPPGPLSAVARAELYTAKGSPVVPLERLQALLAEAPEIPRADQIARLAIARGATVAPAYVQRRQTTWLGNSPSRTRARPITGEPAADQLRAALDPLIRADSPLQAESLLAQAVATLSYEARAEAAQRVAWAYYAIGRDFDARRVADSYRIGARGDWAVQAAWVSGLASWRMGDCNAASASFRQVAGGASQRELSAAGYYWTARAEQACRRPQAVAPLLRAAAASPESFSGLLARETLGSETALPRDSQDHSATVAMLPNVQRAVALVQIGQIALAEEMLRHQAQIGRPTDHHALVDTARRLGLAGAQYWLAHNGQRGATVHPRDRYPVPHWTPVNGWRIDPALALAHIRQESNFRWDAVSPAGAVGLMQVMPTTAPEMARANGIPYSSGSNLHDPKLNIALGQGFIEKIRAMGATRGQLPKVIAAYNAGPTPVARWAWLDRGDPLLWIESIPYWETRYYVPAVFRNMWVYQGLGGAEASTLSALAQHRWPAFPTAHTRLAEAEVEPLGER